MPRTALAPTALPVTGIPLEGALTAANVDGHALAITGRELLVVHNASAAAITVTLVTPGTVQGLDIADRAITVAAGARVIIPVATGIYNQPGSGAAHVNFSAVATVAVALLRV